MMTLSSRALDRLITLEVYVVEPRVADLLLKIKSKRSLLIKMEPHSPSISPDPSLPL